MPKISIITINYNNLEGLKRTIESVVNQTWQEFEYIIIDGGSTDGSAAYIETQKEKFDYWVSEKDSGIYNAMNKGIKVATGEYLLFLNSGDFFVSLLTLHLCYDIISKNQADVFYGQIIVEDNYKDKTILYPEQLTLKYMQKMVINHQACFFKLSTLQDNNGYDERYSLAADYHYYLKLFISGLKFSAILFPIVKYDLSGISSLQMKKYRVEMKQIWNETLPLYLRILQYDYIKQFTTLKTILISKFRNKFRKYLLFNEK